MNSKQIIGVIADYRLVPEVRYPEFVIDSAQAVKWVKSNILQYGGDPDKVFVAGHSAGAYNALMVPLIDSSKQRLLRVLMAVSVVVRSRISINQN